MESLKQQKQQRIEELKQEAVRLRSEKKRSEYVKELNQVVQDKKASQQSDDLQKFKKRIEDRQIQELAVAR